MFEYWTHALSYLPIEHFRFYVRQMRREWRRRLLWFGQVSPGELRRVVSRIRREGPITIRDVAEAREATDVGWGSRKPAKRALEAAFYKGAVTISRRTGMLKTYELTTRHFGWDRLPRAATEPETLDYRLDRALRAQGVVSLDSSSYLNPRTKPAMRRKLEARMRRRELIPVTVEGMGSAPHWIRPDALDAVPDPGPQQTHILSPFDPLVIQRQRFRQLFEYDYRFEAYVPRERRVLGYFVCPVLVGDRVVAALDLKTDRERARLLVQRWHWIGRGGARAWRQRVEEALHRFERFQLGRE